MKYLILNIIAGLGLFLTGCFAGAQIGSPVVFILLCVVFGGMLGISASDADYWSP